MSPYSIVSDFKPFRRRDNEFNSIRPLDNSV
jgi:hypothetical protein